MSTGTRGTVLLLAALVSGLAGIGGAGLGLIGVSEAVSFGAGGALAVFILAGGWQHHADVLYPARMQLARFRRSGEPADILVIELPASVSLAGRRPTRKCASAVSSVLRATDGVSLVPSLGESGLCAVVESDGRARSAIEKRLREACGNQIRLAWASSPDDGVALESLLEVALDRVHEREHGAPEARQGLRPLPVQPVLSRSLEPDRGTMRPDRGTMRSVH
jgi:hypothetical protein